MTERQPSFFRWLLLGGAAFLLFIVVVFLLVFYSLRKEEATEFALATGNRVAVVEIEGGIFDPKNAVEQLEHYGKDSGVKAVVLRLNSPGGSAAATQEIYAAVKRLREEKKKVVVSSLGVVGASGAYYIACASNQIFANPSSITGSIGVVAQWYNYGELLRWAKIRDVVFKSGKFKDTGNPARELTDEEKQYLQALSDDIYEQFVAAVAAGRKMKSEDVRALADGRVFTGSQALKVHLVDRLGGLQDAIEAAAKLAGIKGEPKVIRPPRERRTLLDYLFGDVRDILSESGLMDSHVKFQYLWR